MNNIKINLINLESTDCVIFDNGLDKGQRAKSKELGVEPINSSIMYDTKGKNLHAEEVLMQEVENLEKVGTWPREACGIDEHNCLGQLEDKDIKVEKHNH